MKVTCPKCGLKGSLVRDSFLSKGRHYHYYRIYHYEGKRVRKCMLGKELPDELKSLEDKISKPKIEEEKAIMPEHDERLREIERSIEEEKRKAEIPEPAKGLSIKDCSRGKIMLWLMWEYPYQDPNFDHYEIYKSTSPYELGELIERIDRQGVRAIRIDEDQGLCPNTTYYFTIRVCNKYGKYSDAKFPPLKTKSRLKLLIGKLHI